VGQVKENKESQFLQRPVSTIAEEPHERSKPQWPLFPHLNQIRKTIPKRNPEQTETSTATHAEHAA